MCVESAECGRERGSSPGTPGPGGAPLERSWSYAGQWFRAVVKAPAANLVLDQPKLDINRCATRGAGQVKFVSDRAGRLAQHDFVHLATFLKAVRDEVPRGYISEANAAVRVYHLRRLPHNGFLATEVEPSQVLCPSTTGYFLP
jgi:hypothetical protein